LTCYRIVAVGLDNNLDCLAHLLVLEPFRINSLSLNSASSVGDRSSGAERAIRGHYSENELEKGD